MLYTGACSFCTGLYFPSHRSVILLHRGAAWQPLAVTEAYMGLDPQVFNSEVRRRALDWRQAQEEDFRAKLSATIKERVQAETQAYLTRMGILDTKNPVLKNLKVRMTLLPFAFAFAVCMYMTLARLIHGL